MEGDAQNRWWRRRRWLLLLGFTVLLYPLLLLVSSDFGFSMGLNRDVNASRVLARALSYAADPRLPATLGNDGELVTPALDASLVALQLANSGSGTQPAVPAQGSNASADLAAGAAPPAVPPTAAAPPRLAPPPSVAKPPAAPPPAPLQQPAPARTGSFYGTIVNTKDKPVAGTVYLYRNLQLVATVNTSKNGTFAIPGLTAGTLYGYIATAPQFNPGAGIFKTDGSGNFSANPRVQSPGQNQGNGGNGGNSGNGGNQGN